MALWFLQGKEENTWTQRGDGTTRPWKYPSANSLAASFLLSALAPAHPTGQLGLPTLSQRAAAVWGLAQGEDGLLGFLLPATWASCLQVKPGTLPGLA